VASLPVYYNSKENYMNIREKLLSIQTELHVPKNQYNAFGKYKYRSSEDILEAVKPMCAKHQASIYLSWAVKDIAGRPYIVATATITDIDVQNEHASISVTAAARDADTQKGMNPAQISGSTTSYTGKYALGGLLLLDDTKDDDFNNTSDDSGKSGFTKKPESVGTKDVNTTQPINPTFLGKMQTAKGILNKNTGNDNMYYISLEENGYKKSNQIPKKDQERMLTVFRDLVAHTEALKGSNR
jgi:hypothetical protein